jgi:hypothetical protein
MPFPHVILFYCLGYAMWVSAVNETLGARK